MTEVKNSSVDLLSRQMTGTRKRDEKAVDSFSDFKAMLKGSNQKRGSKSPEAKEDTEDSMVSSEAAASVAAAGMAEVQTPDSEALKNEKELLAGLAKAVGTEEVPVIVPGEDSNIRAMDSLRALDQFRFQKLTENGVGMEDLKEDIQILQSEDLTKVPQPLFAEQSSLLEKTGGKESAVWSSSIQNSEISGPAKEEKGISRNKLLTGAEENGLNPAEKEQPKILEKGDAEEKKTSEEETRKDTLAGLGERPYQPAGSAEHRSEKIEEVHVSVNAENLEELESKLSEQILKQVRGGKGELDIQLEPHNLGKIRIKISYEDNQISVSLLCTESKTLKLLSQTAGDLGSILESSLERPFQIQVDKQETDYLNQQQDQNRGQEQREQHQGRQQDGNREDFIQKLRLGIFEMNGAGEESAGYR
ncbi:flagellar hook-length control protein FliK [Lacrimispora sp.]|uniref:flagellar hook-length control protein FliK n=1 Tax=Lacrimispora sp. TaxID=2719234 RepID=UPI00345FA049